ncbi:S-layer homology domain-containing protein [Paenibacillus monticola]|uniref:S-layer homology domain-containing protein n=1 Tax=Paenibacillus monticola TaxID=2666075 RepID=UPI00189C97B0
MNIIYSSDKPGSSEHVFLRYSDGKVVQAPDDEGASTVTVETYSDKTIVGGYVSDNHVSWVPDYEYGYSTDVTLSNFQSNKPAYAVDHVALAKEPELDINHLGFVNVTLAVYGTDGKLVSGRTEMFAHASDPNVIFHSMDSGVATANEGYSSYTVGGQVTFLIQGSTKNIQTAISLYSGSHLITDNFLKKVTGIEVSSSGDVDSLLVGDSLVMSAGILPIDTAYRAVTWSVLDGTGTATIDADGLLTGISAGTVTVKATATDGSAVYGTKEIEVKPFIPVATLSLTAEGGVSTVVTGALLDMSAVVAPANATNQVVTWSVLNGTGSATINETSGELTAGNPGTITVQATATDGSGIIGSTQLFITVAPTPTPILVSAITINGDSSVLLGQSLQLAKSIAPVEAANQTVVWSVENGTGAASVDANGTLTGNSVGTVTVKATATDGSAVYGTKAVQIVAVSGGGIISGPTTPTVTPTVTPTPTAIPTPTPTSVAQPVVKFDDKVVSIENLLTSLNKKIEEAKAHPITMQFADTPAHWANATVGIFVKLGVVNGYKDGTFHPDASITRAEFATILAKVLDLSSTVTGSALSDISGHWAEASIRTLKDKGIISGYPNGTFKPNDEISRAEIIAMISKIINLNSVNATASSSFSDVEGTWNKDQIQKAAAAGIISGDGSGEFLPNKQASRAEALTIVLHLLQTNPELSALLESIK